MAPSAEDEIPWTERRQGILDGWWLPSQEDEERLEGELWWEGWPDPETARPGQLPTRTMIEYATKRWGEPPPAWRDYVTSVLAGDSPRGAGAPVRRDGWTGVFRHTAFAEAVAVLKGRDGLSLRQAFKRVAEHFGVKTPTIKKHWYGELGAIRQRDTHFIRWLKDHPELMDQHPISPEMDPEPEPVEREATDELDPDVARFREELARRRRS